MAKKLESSKATAKHMKQHTSNTQGTAQINIWRYNHTSQPTKKKKGGKNHTQVKTPSHSNHSSRNSQTNTNLMIEIQISVPDVVTPHMHQDLIAYCLAKKYQCKQCTKVGHFTKMCFTKNAHMQPQHYHKGKPKQEHQIVVPEQSTDQYKNTHECNDNDDFMIAFQLCVQPQKNVHNQKVTTGYTQKCLLTFHIGSNLITNTTSIYVYNLTHVQMST